jgi:putative DNA primase/helicase
VVDSILDLLKTEIFKTGQQFDAQHRLINVLNGELHYHNGLWVLQKHCREHYLTTQLPVARTPKAKAPRFTQFLDEVFRDDEDKRQKATIVLEAIGYSLLAYCAYEKVFLLIGPGANGKSVLMATVEALVGANQVAAVQPSQFENRFQRAHLHRKLVNLVTEIAEGHEIADAQLKAIVSGELTTAEHKHKPPFDFHPFATCWFGTNHLPHTRDFSDALFRRAIILTFNRTFSEEEQDKHLKEKLAAGLPGILNMALEALAGVFERGEFTRAKSSDKAKEEWRINCDHVAQFTEECCTIGPYLSIQSGTLFRVYDMWAQWVGIKPRHILNQKNFTGRLVRKGVKPYKGSHGARMLVNIDLNDDGVRILREIERRNPEAR